MRIERKIPVALAISAVIILAMKLFIPAPETNKAEENAFWLNKTHGESQVNIVVGGDSRIYRGFSAKRLQESLSEKLTSLNLGYSSAGYSDAYLDFLKSRLDMNGKHKIIVIGITPNSLTAEALPNEHYYQYQKVSRLDQLKGRKMPGFYSFFAPLKISELTTAISGNKSKTIYHEEFSDDGWISSWKTPVDFERTLESYRIQFESTKVKNSILDNMIKKLSEFQDENITIIAFRPPSSMQMRQLEDSLSGFDEQFVKKTLTDHGIIWLDFEEDFRSYDGSHLHYTAALKFSGMLAEKINECCLTKP